MSAAQGYGGQAAQSLPSTGFDTAELIVLALLLLAAGVALGRLGAGQ